MPKAAERSFKKQARRIGLKSGTPRYNAYVYGGMQNRGLLKSSRRLKKLKKISRQK
jgi:hypothetical protein